MPLEKSPEAVTSVTSVKLSRLDSVTAFTGEPSGLENCPVHRSTLAWTLPPSPGPKQKKVTVAGATPGTDEGMFNSALRIEEVGGTQIHPSGRGKENDPTEKTTGEGGESACRPREEESPSTGKSETKRKEKSLR